MRYLVSFIRVCGLVLIAFMGCIDFGDSDSEGCSVHENKCEGVVCDSDGNECTEDCNPENGRCEYVPITSYYATCNFEGRDGVCIAGQCEKDPCEGVVCDDDIACTYGSCWPEDGKCHFTNQCYDDDDCTENICNPLDGLCDFPLVEDGTLCDADLYDEWIGAGTCEAGVCVAPCDPASQEELPCPTEGFELFLCCPGAKDCQFYC